MATVLGSTAARGQTAEDPATAIQRARINEPAVIPPADAAQAEAIDGMIHRLGSPKYKEREEATKGLAEAGPEALLALRAAHRRVGDLEVRLRIESVVQTIYMDHHVYGRNGFLGVSLRPYIPDPQRRRIRVPANTMGIELVMVIPGTAAERAGLAVGDVIVKVDEQPLETAGVASVEAFSMAIRSRRPGTPMTLTVLRQGEPFDVKVRMGRCTPEVIGNGRVPAIEAAVMEAENRFPIWWATEFLGAPSGGTGGSGSENDR